MHATTCPDPIRLKELLDNTLSVDEVAEVVAHLDECECCQQRLEHIAAGGSSFAARVCAVKIKKPDETSAFWPALSRVQVEMQHGSITTAEPASPTENEEEEIILDFLAPSESPEYLGRLDVYEIMEPIGHGGMGIVLKAFDPCLQRQVAIKVLAPQFSRNELARKRFCREARAAARVTHENVVAVHLVKEDVEVDVPFLVMQLVEGESLQARLDRVGKLDVRTILKFGQQIASGLAAAHDAGLVHRDIKPANILIEQPLERIKLTDFGLARAEEDAKLTQTGFVAGTPLYMAPEQAKGDPIDHRADLFSLGSVLYAMCTGKPPFDGSTPFVILKNVTEVTPPAIQTLNPDVPNWLVSVITRLQAKNPADRYQSAAEVAELLGEGLAAVQAANPSRLTTKVECPGVKHAAKVGIIAWSIAGVLGVALMITELTGVTRMVTPMFTSGPHVAPLLTLDGNQSPVWSVAFTPDSRSVIAALQNGSVRVWDVASGKVLRTFEVHRTGEIVMTLAPDGKTFATASDDGFAKLWDFDTGAELLSMQHPAGVRGIAFSPDGTKLVTGDREGGVRVWDATTGTKLLETKGHTATVHAVAFSPDSQTFASASADRTIKLWDAKSGLARLTLSGHTGEVLSIGFTPDSQTLVSGGWDRTVRVWDVASGREQRVLEGHTSDVWTVGVCPYGHHVVSGGDDMTVRVWELGTGKEIKSGKAHDRGVYAVAFARDAKLAASAGRDGTVKLWQIED